MPHAEDRFVAGTLGQSGDDVRIASAGTSSLIAHLTGAFSGTITWEARNTTANTWSPIRARQVDTGVTGLTSVLAGAPNNVAFQLPIGGWREVRARCSAYTSGTLQVDFCASNGASDANLLDPSTSGAATVTANQGTANTAANAWPVKVTDGTNTAAVKAASTPAAATDPAAVVALSPGTPLPAGSNALGSVNQGTQNAGGGLSWPVQGAAATGAALAGNPVRIGISDLTNAQDLLSVNQTDAVSGKQAQMIGVPLMAQASATTYNALALSNAVADTSNGARSLPANAADYNGTNWDRRRNNTTTVVQASTLTTVQTINTDIVNYNGRAFMAHANVSNYNGGSILMKLQMKDANGLFVDIPGATTGTLTSGADVLLNVGPTVWPANTATMFNVNYFLPRNIRLVTTIATASVTFSLSYDLPAN